MSTLWPVDILTGGISGSLDNISVSLLFDGDRALAITSSETYHYTYNSTSGGIENLPDVIKPVDATGDERWELVPTEGTVTQEERSAYANSPGLETGGTITEGTNVGTFKISALTAYLRSTNSLLGVLTKVGLAEQDNQTITAADTTYYVMLDYNAGVPQIVISTTNPYETGADYTQISIGRVMKEADDTIHYISGGFSFQDGVRKAHTRATKLRGFELANGSAIAYQDVDQFTMTTGLAYHGLNSWDLLPYDSGLTQFAGIYSDGVGGWTKVNGNVIDTDYYDDGSGTLAIIGNNRYSVHWVFKHPDDCNVFTRYGTDSYALAEAEVAKLPTVSGCLDDLGLLIGKIIAPKGGGSFAAVQMVTDTVFVGANVTDHGALSGLSDDDHIQYHNDARGDARYYTQAQVDGDIDTHAADVDAHHTRYTDTEAEAAINADGDHGATASHDNLDSDTIDFNAEYDNGTVAVNTDIDWTNGNNQVITLGASITLTFSNMGVGHKQLRINMDTAGGRTVTLPVGLWPGGTVGTLDTSANAINILSIFNNGIDYYFQMVKGWS